MFRYRPIICAADVFIVIPDNKVLIIISQCCDIMWWCNIKMPQWRCGGEADTHTHTHTHTQSSQVSQCELTHLCCVFVCLQHQQAAECFWFFRTTSLLLMLKQSHASPPQLWVIGRCRSCRSCRLPLLPLLPLRVCRDLPPDWAEELPANSREEERNK